MILPDLAKVRLRELRPQRVDRFLRALPSNVRMIHGPGCPVCVLPVGRIDNVYGDRNLFCSCIPLEDYRD